MEFIRDQLTNEVKVLSGKDKKQTFGTTVYQISHALCAQGKSIFKELKNIPPLHYPSVSSMKQLKAQNRIEDGRGSKIYKLRAAAKEARQIIIEYCYAMCDEIHLKQGIKYYSTTGKSIGHENDMLDITSILHRLLSVNQGSVEKAKKANQRLFISYRASKFESWCGEFFLNDGSLTGKTLLNQFLNVLFKCESIGSQILGLVMDAGGSNAHFMDLLSNLTQKEMGHRSWLDDNKCYIQNPWCPRRRIYFWF